MSIQWPVIFCEEFEPEFESFNESVQDELLSRMSLLSRFAPQLGRPYADTLNGSEYSNMKELRFNADNGVWRVAFAFDSERQAIILIAGDKAGQNEKRFYKKLIEKADARFSKHLEQLG